MALFLSLFPWGVFAHAGHHHGNLLSRIGSFHLLILHFPIALLYMTALAELLFWKTGSLLYTHAAKFMLTGATWSALLTALFGWLYGWHGHYEGLLATHFWWHRFLGLATLPLFCLALFLKREKRDFPLYVLILILLLLLITCTGYFGGMLSFPQFQ